MRHLVLIALLCFALPAAALPPTPFAWTPLGDKVSDLGGTYVLFTVIRGEPVALYRDAYKGTKTLVPTDDVRYEPALRSWRDGRWIEHPFPWRHVFFPSVTEVDGKPVLAIDDVDAAGNGIVRFLEWQGGGKLSPLPCVAPLKRPPYPRAGGARLAKYPHLFRIGGELALFYTDERPVLEHVTRDFRHMSSDRLADAGVVNAVALQAHGRLYAAWQDPAADYAAVLRSYDGARWQTLALPHRPTRSPDPIYLFESAGHVYFTEARKDGLDLVLHEIGANGALKAIAAPGLGRAPRYSFATLRGRLYAAFVEAGTTSAALATWDGKAWTNHAVAGFSSDVRAVHLAADEDAGRLYLLYEYQRIDTDAEGRIRIDHRMRAVMATPP